MISLQTITQKAFIKRVLCNKFLLTLGFFSLIIIFSLLSYGKAFDYYFWRDDTKVVWMEKHTPALINNFSTLGTARARIGSVFFDFMEYTTLGFESVPHQIFGFVLRLLNIFLVYFFAKRLFKSQKIAIVSCIFAASFIGGLEAYSWVRGIGLMITFCLISFISYLKSYQKRSWLWFGIAVLFAAAALSMDIWRTMGIIILIATWEGLHLFVKNDQNTRFQISKKLSILRISIFLFVQFLLLKVVLIGSNSAGGSVASSANGYVKMAMEGVTWGHFATSIGNLIRIPFLYVQEEGGLTDAGKLSTFFGIVFLIVLLGTGIQFLIKRQKTLIPWIILLMWIPLFYGPNWLYAQTLEVASTHRYIAFSAIVVPIIWAKIVVTKLPAKIGFVMICLFVLFGITHARAIVDHDYTIRGKDFVVPIWQKVANSTPIGETNQLLSVTGDNRVIGYVFAWSDVFPFATLKNIGAPQYLPLYANVSIASQVLCNPDATIPDPITGNFSKAGKNFSINKTYAWYIKDSNTMTETTDEFRLNVTRSTPCLWKSKEYIFSNSVKLEAFSAIPLKQSENTYAFLTKWKTSTLNSGNLNYVASISSEGSAIPLDIKIGKVNLIEKADMKDSNINFEFKKMPKINYQIKLFVCQRDCTNVSAGQSVIIPFNELLSISTHESLE